MKKPGGSSAVGGSKKAERIHTKIWEEVPHEEDEFAAKKCMCAGYDVYGDLLGKISWAEYIYLLFKLDPPAKDQSKLLEGIAISIANPGPRDLSVRSAMNAGVGGATSASCLIAALGAGAGQYQGAREVYLGMKLMQGYGRDLAAWTKRLKNYQKLDDDFVWPDIEHIPCFDPYSPRCSLPTSQVLDYLETICTGGSLSWLKTNQEALEEAAKSPIAFSFVIACAFLDLGFNKDQAEMAYLLFRLPGASVHALEQKKYGVRNYPFFMEDLNLTGPMTKP